MAVEAGWLEAIGEAKGKPINAATVSKDTGWDVLLIGMSEVCKNMLHALVCSADGVRDQLESCAW